MKYKTTIYLILSFIYYEIVFRIFNNLSYFNKNFLLVIVFSILIGSLLSTAFSILSKKYHNLLLYITLFICSVYYSVQLCLSNFYGFYFSLSLIHLSDQVGDFAKDAVNVVLANSVGILFLLLPFIFALFFFRKYEHHPWDKKELTLNLIITQISLFLYCLLIFMPFNRNSIYNRIYKSKNMSIKINELGVINSFLIDASNNMFGHSSTIIVDDKPVDDVVHEDIFNVIDFDFEKANENTNNNTIKDLNNYFVSQKGSKQNQYTGYFKNKNLIYIMAESFNEIAVNKDLTPTLYKMIHSGFEFNDFYSATILSTIGGEFMELTGMYADYDVLSIWRDGSNSYPMGLANSFKKQGYSTFAYHDSQYNFQDRDTYLNSIGFDNYEGCGNGLESKMECRMNAWPPYDSDMIDGTINDYINKNKFMVFYATVSGHGDYGFNTNDTTLNSHVSTKYEQLVRDYYKDQSFNDHILAYVAGQIELDRALEKLLNHLERADKLDDTVIVLCGDHYPYYLEFDEMSKLAGYQRDYQIECNSSNLIIYNSRMHKISIDKPSCTMDILPTVYNLFSIPYDSRMIMGKDILSDEEALVILNNGSWVSDYGKYYANEARFEASKQIEDEENYITGMNDKVNNRMLLTYYIMTNNYYDYIWNFKK